MQDLPNTILAEITQIILSNKTLKLFDYSDVEYPISLLNLYNIIHSIGLEKCLQSMPDSIFLYDMVFSKKPKNILEVGRWHGYSTAIMSGALVDLNNDGKVFSMDLVDRLSDTTKDLLKNNTVLITDDCAQILSHEDLCNMKFDLFFIDNDRPHAETSQDFLNYLTLASDHAYFLFHNMQTPNIGYAVLEVVENSPQLQYLGMFGSSIGLVTTKKNLAYD
jgi:hypothetical protein